MDNSVILQQYTQVENKQQKDVSKSYDEYVWFFEYLSKDGGDLKRISSDHNVCLLGPKNLCNKKCKNWELLNELEKKFIEYKIQCKTYF